MFYNGLELLIFMKALATEVVEPLSSMFNDSFETLLGGLYRRFPAAFHGAISDGTLRDIHQYQTRISCVVDVMENFEAIKQVSKRIYHNHRDYEALAVSQMILSTDDKHKKIIQMIDEITGIVRDIFNAGQQVRMSPIKKSGGSLTLLIF